MNRYISIKIRLAALLGLGLCAALTVQAQFGGGGFGGFGGGGGRTTSRSSGSSARTYSGNGAVGDAVISFDEETRSLIVIADEDTSTYISQVVSNLDRPKPQVLIKVVFVELQHSDASDIGIEGGMARHGMNGTVNSAAGANVFGLSALNTVASNAPLNSLGLPVSSFSPVSPITSSGAGLYQMLGQDFQVTLRAIAQAGKAKVLSRPSIVARNNQPATITVGQSVPLITSVRFDNYGNAINSVSYQDVGIILRVTPFITADNMVEMIVAPETSELLADRSQWVSISSGASGDVKAPIINSRAADTVVVTPDGQTVIIGGLMQDSKAESETKIPLLGDIPVLGNLFKRKAKNGAKTELLIFLTPYIIQAPTELAAITGQQAEKFSYRKSLTESEVNRYIDTLPTNAPPAEIQAPPAKKKSGSRGGQG